MDRPLDPFFRRKQLIKRLLLSAVTLALAAGAWAAALAWVKPSISRNRLRTAVVEVGPVEATIEASGTVVPEFEQVLSSPFDARVLKVLKRPGAVLSKGESILELDVNATRLAWEKLNEQIALKVNQQTRLRLDLDNTLTALQSQHEAKRLDLQFLKARSAQSRELHRQGILAENELRQAELQEEKAAIELKQVEDGIRIARQSTQAQSEGLALEMNILQKERAEARRQWDLATTRADRHGVLTWVIPEEGVTVRKGDVLARLTDLSAFRVDATVSDVHATRVAAGRPVRVKVNEDYLSGSVAAVLPAVQNGIITLQVRLDEKSDPRLRSNLRVDVFIITDRRERALRVKKGPFANGTGAQEAFVVRGGVAVRTPIQLGIAGFDHYEVAGGLLDGDELIISDMSPYSYLKEVRLK